MEKSLTNKTRLLAILAGFVATVLIGIFTTEISFFINVHKISWLSMALSFVPPILGGFVVGWLIKERGTLYGGILGITLILISIGIISLAFLSPSLPVNGSYLTTQDSHYLAQQSIFNQLFNSPITIMSTALGGYLGERLRKRK